MVMNQAIDTRIFTAATATIALSRAEVDSPENASPMKNVRGKCRTVANSPSPVCASSAYSSPRSAPGEGGRSSRFFGSSFWQAYYVEYTILAIVVCVLALRGLEYALEAQTGEGEFATVLHFPLTFFIGEAFSGLSTSALESAIVAVAAVKILVSMAWFITIALQPTMGVAWHRFLAFPNIWFKRHADGRTSLGELQPISVEGKPIDFENIDELDEDAALGVGKVEDFTWKGLLDFSTCTECGRCQSQCPAWNTEKPLSPKLLIMNLRDHALAHDQ